MGSSEPDLRSSPVNSHLSLSRQTLDAGSQTNISGDVSSQRASAAQCCPPWDDGVGWGGMSGVGGDGKVGDAGIGAE